MLNEILFFIRFSIPNSYAHYIQLLDVMHGAVVDVVKKLTAL
jgi:hypothetical protein